MKSWEQKKKEELKYLLNAILGLTIDKVSFSKMRILHRELKSVLKQNSRVGIIKPPLAKQSLPRAEEENNE